MRLIIALPAIGLSLLGLYFVYGRLAAPPIVAGCAFVAPTIPPSGSVALREPPEVRSQDGVLDRTLDVRYADNVLSGCPVQLRWFRAA